eukprot:1339844-Rhodomonas_salina.3
MFSRPLQSMQHPATLHGWQPMLSKTQDHGSVGRAWTRASLPLSLGDCLSAPLRRKHHCYSQTNYPLELPEG